MVTRRTSIWFILTVVLVLLAIGGNVSARSNTPQSPEAVAITPLLQYQGRLTNPTTGQPVSDGVYVMTLSLYDVAAGGTALWFETKNVQVTGGLFSTALGDSTPLAQSLFSGQSVWLGIKVGSDLEATPRQAVLPVAYALSLVPGASISGSLTSPALTISNSTGSALYASGPTTLAGNVTINGTGGLISPALRVSNSAGPALVTSGTSTLGGNVTINGTLSGGTHAHSGADITSGTVVDVRIDPLIARDAEVAASYYDKTTADTRYVNATGPESLSASSTAPALSVNQTGSGVGGYFTSTTTYGVRGETASTSGGQAGVLGVASWVTSTLVQESGVEGKSFDGYGVSGISMNHYGVIGYSTNSVGVRGEAVAGSSAGVWGGSWGTGPGVYGYSSNGYAGYFSGGQGAIYASGSVTVTGNLNVQGTIEASRVTYSTPRVQYFTVGGSGFVPGTNVDYANAYGNGGAYIVSGSGALVAPVHLPHGAVVTEFRVYYYDASSLGDLTVRLEQESMSSGYYIMGEVASSGTAGYGTGVDTSVSAATIDNTSYSYLIYAYSPTWDSINLRMKAAVIKYTVAEVP